MILNPKPNKNSEKDLHDKDIKYTDEIELIRNETLKDHYDDMKSSDLFKDDEDFTDLYKELYINATKDLILEIKTEDRPTSYSIEYFHTFFMNRKNKMYKIGKYYYGKKSITGNNIREITFIDLTYLTQKDREQLLEFCYEYTYFLKQMIAQTIYGYEKFFEDYDYDNEPVIPSFETYKEVVNAYTNSLFNTYEYIKIIHAVNREVLRNH